MEIGIALFAHFPFEEIVEVYKKHGINHTFIGSETKEFDKVMQLFSDNGIICDSLHAPFNNINDMWKEDDEAANAMLLRLKDSVDKCAKFSIPNTVVHISSKTPMPEITEKGYRNKHRPRGKVLYMRQPFRVAHNIFWSFHRLPKQKIDRLFRWS